MHPLRADGTVDITWQEAWPNHGTEPAPLSANELAKACALQAACSDIDLSKGGDEDQIRSLLLNVCVNPSQSYFWEERAVPTTGENERWTFEARAIQGGGCNAVVGAHTPRLPEITCEEVGCWWKSKEKPVPDVSCNGNIATLQSGSSFTRDCSHAFGTCDANSPTGCTDRLPTACEHPAKDRCDGDKRIGCDGTGRVSFHDCSRVPGGNCVENAGSASCVYPDNTGCVATGCNADHLSICVLGSAIDVDCKGLGLSTCAAGYCKR